MVQGAEMSSDTFVSGPTVTCCQGSDNTGLPAASTRLVRLTVCAEAVSLRRVSRTVTRLLRTDGITNTSAIETAGKLTSFTGCHGPYNS